MKVFKTITSIFFSLLLIFYIQGNAFAQDSPATEETKNSNIESSPNADFQKLLEESKKIPDPQTSLKDDVKVETVQSPQNSADNVKAKTPTYANTTKEVLAFSLVGFIFLILNFFGSIFKPKLRYLFIGTPFDLGVREEKTESQRAVESKRNGIELFLLLIIIGVYYFFAVAEKSEPEENIPRMFTTGAVITVFCYIFYIVVRIFWGLSSKCPQCKNMFAVDTSSYKEPKSTYEQRGYVSRRQPPFRSSQQVDVYEIGVNHGDHSCSVCGYQWQTARNYKNKISTYHVDV